MMYFKIENDAEIEPEALTLIGASTKREDTSKIGFFGSGLKYAIAVLLRNGIGFKIFSGTKEVEVTTKDKKFRGQNFKAICFNGKETSLTTEMGSDWRPWFAVREIYCNAKDEDNFSAEIISTVEPQEGKTQFYIEMSDKLNELMLDWDRYFSDKREPLFVAGKDKVFPNKLGDRAIVYRKGIQCQESSEPSLFDYDLYDVQINESRTVMSLFEVRSKIAELLARHIDEHSLAFFLDNILSRTFERGAWWAGVSDFNENWLKVIGTKTLIPEEVSGWFSEEYTPMSSIILPNNIVQALAGCFGDKIKIAGTRKGGYSNDMLIEPNERQSALLSKATDFIGSFYGTIPFSIRLCNFEKENQLGEAFDGEVLLSPTLFEQGTRKIVEVILEEMFHLKSKSGDKTRDFQNYLISQLVTIMETTKRVYL